MSTVPPVNSSTAAEIFGESSANWSSIMNTPSSPAKKADVAPGADQHVQAIGNRNRLDRHVLHVLLRASGQCHEQAGERQ